jgi:hypothetical protein
MTVVKHLSEAVRMRVCAATGARAVTRVEGVQRLWSGYGEILRVWLLGGQHASVIVKLVQPPTAAAGDEARAHLRKMRSYDVELGFYQRYAHRCAEACRVARCLSSEKLGGGWLFVLEDLNAAGLTQRREQLPLHAVRTCLDWLARFHATFLGEAPVELWPVGTYWHLDTRPDELARSTDPQLTAAATWLDARLRGATFRTLVHGDAKVENFCFSDDLTTVAAVDFQYSGSGCGVQDVAYFLGSCLSERACEAHADALLDFYFEASSRLSKAVEEEWRALWPIAWADFARFMSGWAPGWDTRSGYAGRMTQLALLEFERASAP